MVPLVLYDLAVYVGHLLGHIELDVNEGGSELFGEGGFELGYERVTLTVRMSL